jgi:hypothetical protein
MFLAELSEIGVADKAQNCGTAELVACRTSTPWKLRRHKRRFGRGRDCDCAVGTVGADRMKTADALMVIYYLVLSGALVFTLGYLAGWRHAKRRQ